jgi:hypothetical protein
MSKKQVVWLWSSVKAASQGTGSQTMSTGMNHHLTESVAWLEMRYHPVPHTMFAPVGSYSQSWLHCPPLGSQGTLNSSQ